MNKPLLLQLLELWLQRYPPDVLSIEYPEEDAVINFEWFSGKKRQFRYNNKVYDLLWSRFNTFCMKET